MDALRLEKAHFILSVPSVDLLPASQIPEIALLGRSNVGKSSFLNYLTGQKNLARASKTPGRTRALNLFEAELEKQKIHILDLPGLGYAKLSLSERTQLSQMISTYLQERKALNCLLHLLDCRRDPTSEDISLSLEFREQVPEYQVILSKIDQIPISKRKNTQKRFAKLLFLPLESCWMISSEKQLGRENLLLDLAHRLTLKAL